MSEHLVVVGGGQAAAQAVQSSRQLGFEGAITLIGDEPCLPYQRPPLSKKYLAGEMPRERLQLKPEKFYASREVELLLGVSAEELDCSTRTLRLGDGRRMTYDRLILATGSRARRLDADGSALAGIHYIRTVRDIDALAPGFVAGRRLVVVGAGYIGLEAAAVAIKQGLEVTVLEAQSRILSRVVCPETAAFFERYHERAGVAIRCSVAVRRFGGQTRVDSVETSTGQAFACDLVIVGVGAAPNIGLAEAAGLECDNGIAVDACAMTADPRVAAAGDCTSQPHPFVGRRVRLESVHNAVEQGKAAAESLLASPRPFSDIPWFWSDQYDLKLQIAGYGANYDETVVRGDTRNPGFSVFYLAAGRPVAVDAVNNPRDFMVGKKLLAARKPVPAEALADPATDLARLAAPD